MAATEFVTPKHSMESIYTLPSGFKEMPFATYQHPKVASHESEISLDEVALFVMDDAYAIAMGGSGNDRFEIFPPANAETVLLIYGMAGDDVASVHLNATELKIVREPGQYTLITSLPGYAHNVHIELEGVEQVRFDTAPFECLL
ncbi:hypothetical protein [Limoniibacter endophyticus]|uniref:Uncharacterized protein n=1 Tax=Limoniibacter endophyticus TaxID=1565040 RepID=A0A8J3DHH4_9HYPH|nr:hypothetical protein [Limoniibacter endophyticus]GHC71282.1 hypothetical protein GCM10010136_18340 [Limoniibacter endophyticus]